MPTTPTTPTASAGSWLRSLVRWLAAALVIAIVVGALLSVGHGTFADFLRRTSTSMVYASLIGLPAMLLFPRLGPRMAQWQPLRRWLTYLGVLLVIIAAGTLAAGLVLVAIGRQSMGELWIAYVQGLQISGAVAVPFALGATVYFQLRARLARTEASLHAKELEHQRALGLATEARLASLESRVRPHFLFNALNSAIALIPEDPRRAEKLLERLAGLLRFSLDAASATVSLGEEIRVVTDYLEIEQVRFGDRLRFAIDVPDELRGAMIPAFAVQTVVENSVKYAVSASKAGAHIAVRARRDGGRLRLEITDDGPGFTGPIWLSGHGLDGLRARLDALYGSTARLVAPVERAANAPGGGAGGAGGGAGVVIDLPAPQEAT
ncbi:MAG TPA: histidine kinase [Kofleriaceae bacterium]|nr:histidine kinase [Kofleriaceae bacterium]